MKTLLIDDDRDFLDGRDYDIARSSSEAIEFFLTSDGVSTGASYETVWLDFSLRGGDSIMDFIFLAARKASAGEPLAVERFVIHTSSWDGAALIKQILEGAGYSTVRFDITTQENSKVIGIRPSGNI